MKAPAAVRREHDELHAQLARATRDTGRTGEAARLVARIMHPHFLREDEYAMPPLGLLPQLARGHVDPEMRAALPLVARLKDELPLMLEEHKAIKGGLLQLAEAAEGEQKRDIAETAKALLLHAQMEEEVLYPAALLVGEYLTLKLKK